MGEQRGSFSVFIILAGVGGWTEKGGGNLILARVGGFDMIPCDAWGFRLLGWAPLSNSTGFICTTSAVGRLSIPFSSDSVIHCCLTNF